MDLSTIDCSIWIACDDLAHGMNHSLARVIHRAVRGIKEGATLHPSGSHHADNQVESLARVLVGHPPYYGMSDES